MFVDVCTEHVFIYPIELWPESQIYVDLHILYDPLLIVRDKNICSIDFFFSSSEVEKQRNWYEMVKCVGGKKKMGKW